MPREILRSARSLHPDGTELVEEEWRDGPGWSALTAGPDGSGDTRYEILDGLARVRIGRTDRIYRAGESVIVRLDQGVTLEPVEGEGVHLLVQRWAPAPPEPIDPTERETTPS